MRGREGGCCVVGVFGAERVERMEVLLDAGIGSIDLLWVMPRMREALST